MTGRKNQPGSSGEPTGGNENTTGSKRVRDSGDKSGLTPDEKVTKNTHGKTNSRITSDNNCSSENSGSTKENNNVTYASVVDSGNSNSANTDVDEAVASQAPSESPEGLADTETNEQESMVTDNVNSCTNYRNSNTVVSDSEDDLNPLTREDEEQLRRQSDPTAELDEPPTKKSKSFADAAKQKRAFEILYVHKGDKERAAIEKDTFYKLMDKLQGQALDKVLEGETFPNNILWYSWSKGRGLVAVEDKETSDHLIKELSVLKLGKQVFRAWHRDQTSEGKLVSIWLAGNGTARFKAEQITKALLKQNNLTGQVTGEKFTNVGKGGRLLIFFADKTLWNNLLARNTSATGGKVVLKLGTFRVVAQLSRSVPTVEALSLADEAAGTSSGVEAGCSKD